MRTALILAFVATVAAFRQDSTGAATRNVVPKYGGAPPNPPAPYHPAPPSKPVYHPAPPSKPVYHPAPPSKPVYNPAPPSKPVYNPAPPSKPVYNPPYKPNSLVEDVPEMKWVVYVANAAVAEGSDADMIQDLLESAADDDDVDAPDFFMAEDEDPKQWFTEEYWKNLVHSGKLADSDDGDEAFLEAGDEFEDEAGGAYFMEEDEDPKQWFTEEYWKNLVNPRKLEAKDRQGSARRVLQAFRDALDEVVEMEDNSASHLRRRH
ncbi:Aste57867_21664 [Aphanomyces stellatus]|uniref:Aste57867_21664 protein n=1 Tax=Aphanomyces stellatus TaxID=120398 RepID=A0A485LJG0_9STRA|nr:hypothetical protein As57867_021595 [Aphanomyces stellatus]VFT98333.1 Aste57867_21664 [Aphanomyces stellatus]